MLLYKSCRARNEPCNTARAHLENYIVEEEALSAAGAVGPREAGRETARRSEAKAGEPEDAERKRGDCQSSKKRNDFEQRKRSKE